MEQNKWTTTTTNESLNGELWENMSEVKEEVYEHEAVKRVTMIRTPDGKLKSLTIDFVV